MVHKRSESQGGEPGLDAAMRLVPGDAAEAQSAGDVVQDGAASQHRALQDGGGDLSHGGRIDRLAVQQHLAVEVVGTEQAEGT